jgi:hypothetical protein
MQNEIISMGQASVPLDDVKAALQQALGTLEELLDRLEQTPPLQAAATDEAQVRHVISTCIRRGDLDFTTDEMVGFYSEICVSMGLKPVPGIQGDHLIKMPEKRFAIAVILPLAVGNQPEDSVIRLGRGQYRKTLEQIADVIGVAELAEPTGNVFNGCQ